MVYLVVRMKGTVNVPRWADLTLVSLHLDKKFRATIIPENEQSLGMLRKIKEWVSWSSVDDAFIKEFIEKKGRVSSSRLLTTATATATVPSTTATTNDAVGDNGKSNNSGKENTGGNGDSQKSQNIDLDKVTSTISQNQLYLSKIPGIKPWFALSPPKGGFRKKSKRSYSQNGVLGENKELVSLVKRMM
jgi:large subunit ribosomal protein L30